MYQRLHRRSLIADAAIPQLILVGLNVPASGGIVVLRKTKRCRAILFCSPVCQVITAVFRPPIYSQDFNALVLYRDQKKNTEQRQS